MTGLVGVMRLYDLSQKGMGAASTEEVDSMSETQAGPNGYKTIGVRLADPVHAQMVLISSLEGVSLTDAIKQAIEYYIGKKKGEGDLAARAAKAAEEIERDAQARRDALSALFGTNEAETPAKPTGSTSRRRTGEAKP